MKNPRTRFILILGLVLVLAVIAIWPSLSATMGLIPANLRRRRKVKANHQCI